MTPNTSLQKLNDAIEPLCPRDSHVMRYHAKGRSGRARLATKRCRVTTVNMRAAVSATRHTMDISPLSTHRICPKRLGNRASIFCAARGTTAGSIAPSRKIKGTGWFGGAEWNAAITHDLISVRFGPPCSLISVCFPSIQGFFRRCIPFLGSDFARSSTARREGDRFFPPRLMK